MTDASIDHEAMNKPAALSDEEIAKRKKMIDDYHRFHPKIPPHLQAVLEEALADKAQARSALLEILLLAIQAGRYFQGEDDIDEAIMLHQRQQEAAALRDLKKATPSPLLTGLLDVNGRELRNQQHKLETFEPKDVKGEILVVPGNALPPKVH